MKKDEINKGSIIIGIAAFAIIAIVIIGAISFFSPKSHAQVQGNDFDKVTVSALNKLNSKSLKGEFGQEWFKKNQKDYKFEFKTASFANKFNAFGDKEQFDEGQAMFKSDYKPFTFAFANAKGAEKLFSAKSFVQYEKENFKVGSYFENEKHS